jgi:UDP:flavonoid glycosyltransferase YjiC (YdhE family)
MAAGRRMRILFAIVGVGAGNATRNLAIFQEIERLAPDAEILVAAQGKAEEILRERYQVHSLQRVSYGGDGATFSPWTMIRSNLSFPARFRANVKTYGRLIDDWKPDVVVADSDFYCLGPARKRGVRLLTINNSAYIVETFRRYNPRPSGCFFSYRFIERSDYWLQRHYPNEVICPVLRPQPELGVKYRQIDPIARVGFDRSTPDPSAETDELVVMLGGSGIGADSLDLRFYKGPLTALGPLPKAPPQTTMAGFQLDPLPWLKRARRIIIQGGFSSISEMLALGKLMVVAPIPGHAEQRVNARTVEAMGLGVACEDGRLDVALARLDEREQDIRRALAESPMRFNGAEQAARIILGMPLEDAPTGKSEN